MKGFFERKKYGTLEKIFMLKELCIFKEAKKYIFKKR